MKITKLQLTAFALITLTGAAFAKPPTSLITLINDTQCQITDQGINPNGTPVDINSYTIDNPTNPQHVTIYSTLTSNEPGLAPVIEYKGSEGVLVGDAQQLRYSFTPDAAAGDFIVYDTYANDNCSTGEPCYALYNANPCSVSSAKKIAVLKTHPL